MKPVSTGLPVSWSTRSPPTMRGDLGALGAGALVVPEDAGAQRLAGRIQRHQPVHLAAEADAGDVGRVDAGLRQDGANTLDRAVPKQGGILLGPERLRCLERVLGGGHGDHRAGVVDQQCLGGGR